MEKQKTSEREAEKEQHGEVIEILTKNGFKKANNRKPLPVELTDTEACSDDFFFVQPSAVGSKHI